MKCLDHENSENPQILEFSSVNLQKQYIRMGETGWSKYYFITL